MGEDEWEQMKREGHQWPTAAQYMARQQHIKARGYGNTWNEPRGVQWAYQKPDAPAEAPAVIDFTNLVQPCSECGAAGYVWFAPDGLMQVRYRCGHVPARDEDDERGG